MRTKNKNNIDMFCKEYGSLVDNNEQSAYVFSKLFSIYMLARNDVKMASVAEYMSLEDNIELFFGEFFPVLKKHGCPQPHHHGIIAMVVSEFKKSR